MALIVFEGIDGCGKSTQLQRFATRARELGHDPLCLREPGGTALGEAIRVVLLDPATEADPMAELLAYQTARAQLVRAVIQPALAAGRLVLLDRFWYSTIAYQADGLGLDRSQVEAAIAVAVGDCQPDAAIYCHVPLALAQARRAGGQADRIESRDDSYHQRVLAGYDRMAAEGVLHAIDGTAEVDVVAAAVWQHCGKFLNK